MPEATIPNKIVTPKPDRLNSFLSDGGTQQILHWAFVPEDVGSYNRPVRIFDGSVDPAVYGWAFNNSGSGAYSYNYGTYNTVNISTQASGESAYFNHNTYFIATETEIADNSIGNTFDLVFNTTTISDDSVYFNIDDGTYTEQFIINSDKVKFKNADVYYTIDTTEFHTYSITLKDTALKLYVDNIIVIDTTLTTVSSGTKDFSFGIFSCTAAAEFDIAKIIFYNNALVKMDVEELQYQVLLDTSEDFNTINLQTYTSESATVTTNGIVTAFTVTLPPRQLSGDISYYWKVKIIGDYYTSDYSDINTFILKANDKIDYAHRLIDSLPDENSYELDTYSGNIASIYKGFGKAFDDCSFEIYRTKQDLLYSQMRDSKLTDTLGTILGVDRSAFSNIIAYRDFLKNAAIQYFNLTTTDSISEIIKLITGVNPQIIEQYKKVGWTIHSSTTNPAVKYYLRDDEYPELQPISKLYSSGGKAFSFDIHIFNPYDITYDKTLVKDLIYLFKPAHTFVNIFYYNADGSVYMLPCYYAIDYYGIGYYSDKGIEL